MSNPQITAIISREIMRGSKLHWVGLQRLALTEIQDNEQRNSRNRQRLDRADVPKRSTNTRRVAS
jgi:hypothetical protein